MKHDIIATASKVGHWTDYQCRKCRRGFRILAGTEPVWPEDCTGKPATPARPYDGPPLVESGPVPIVPIRSTVAPHSYRGVCAKKPWEYQVTVALPCLDHADETAVCVELLRAQTVKPFFVLVDTGSTPAEAKRLDAMRAADLEVHRIACNGVRYSSDLVAIALDLCFSRADTPYVFTTHQDCFVRRRDLLEYLIREIRSQGGHAVVGWQLTPRFHADWRQHFGHTATLFDLAAWDAMGATWTLRRAMRDGPRAHDDPEHRGTGVWPDTESTMNTTLLRCKAKTKFLGTEENGERNKDEWIDHCRSLVCGSLYCPERHERAKAEMVDAMREARERLAEWRGEKLGPAPRTLPEWTPERFSAWDATCRICVEERIVNDNARKPPARYCQRDLDGCSGCITRAVGMFQARLAGQLVMCEKWNNGG